MAGDGLALGLAFAFAAAALAIKQEGPPQVFAFLLALSVLWAFSRRGRVAALWPVVGAAFLLACPWLIWQGAHDVPREIALADLLGIGRHNTDGLNRLDATVETFARHLLSPREWLFAVPLVLVLSLAVFVRRRRLAWLYPFALILAGCGLVAWIIWVGPPDIDERMRGTSNRILLPIGLLAAVLVPLLAEALLRGRDHRARGP
jgi:hypothetical protein